MEETKLEQENIMLNPNQTWFPHVLQFRATDEMPDCPTGYIGSSGHVIVDVVDEHPPEPGDIFFSPYGRSLGVFIKAIDSREAYGDWDKPFWKGIKPHWYRCLCELQSVVK